MAVTGSAAPAHGGGPRRPGSMRGQVMVLFLVLAGVLCLGLLLMFNTGQTVNKKVRLTHAADAAAYSVAVQQAKAYNFAAYMNRAQVANEVTIAQLVSIWSWSNMVHTHTLVGYNLFTYLSGIAAGTVVLAPAVPILQAIARAYKIAEQVVAVGRTGYQNVVTLGGVVPGLEGGFVSALSRVNQAYSLATTAVLDYVSGVDSYNLAARVATANDPEAKLDPVAKGLLVAQLAHATAHLDSGFLVRYDREVSDAGMDRFRNVIMASRDEFTADRGQNADLWLAEIGSWGGTDLVDYDRWAGMDTMFIELKIPLPWPADDLDLSQPLGWGGAQAIKDKNDGLPPFLPGIQSGENGGEGWFSHDHNNTPEYAPYGESRGRTARWANDYPSVNTPWLWGASSSPTEKEDAYFEDYQGLQPYYDVNTELSADEQVGPKFTVFLHSDVAIMEQYRTAEQIDGFGAPTGGKLRLEDKMAGGRISAIATAQTYFHRPPDNSLFQRLVPGTWNGTPRSDSQLEKGNLFSPYWQARLVETPVELYTLAGAADAFGL